MSNDQTNDPTSKSKPLHVVVDEGGGGADLNSVGVIGRVLKQTVVGVEDLTRQKEEEFTTWTTVIKSEGKEHIEIVGTWHTNAFPTQV